MLLLKIVLRLSSAFECLVLMEMNMENAGQYMTMAQNLGYGGRRIGVQG